MRCYDRCFGQPRAPLTVISKAADRQHMTVHLVQIRRSIRRHLVAACILAGALVAGLGGWARTTELAGAVIANGRRGRRVRCEEGPASDRRRRRRAQRARRSATSMLETSSCASTKRRPRPISPSSPRASMSCVARQARLEAEKDGADSIDFPDELLAREKSDPELRIFLKANASCSVSRSKRGPARRHNSMSAFPSSARRSSGLAEQIEAKTQEIALIEEELKGVVELWEKQLVPITRVTSLQAR